MKTIKINDVSMDLHEVASNRNELVIEITHHYTNTFIDLSKMSQCEIKLYDFKGKKINKLTIKEKCTGPFFILTQAKKIYLYRHQYKN